MQRCSRSEVSFLHLALMVRLVSRSISASDGMKMLRRAEAEVGVGSILMVVAGSSRCSNMATYKCMSTSGSCTWPNVLKVIVPHPPCILEGFHYFSPCVLFPIPHNDHKLITDCRHTCKLSRYLFHPLAPECFPHAHCPSGPPIICHDS